MLASVFAFDFVFVISSGNHAAARADAPRHAVPGDHPLAGGRHCGRSGRDQHAPRRVAGRAVDRAPVRDAPAHACDENDTSTVSEPFHLSASGLRREQDSVHVDV